VNIIGIPINLLRPLSFAVFFHSGIPYKKMLKIIRIALLSFFLFSLPLASWSKESVRIIYVNNVRGNNDTGDGSAEKPFSSIMRGVKELRPGILLNVANTGTDYHETIKISAAGTVEEPIVIDGNGAVNSGMMRRPLQDWKSETGGVFSIKLPNNAWGMQNHWEGGFELVRFAGKPGRNVTSREALEPFTYFLYKNQKKLKTDPLHDTLFIRLPEGKTPDNTEVRTISILSPFCVVASNVTVRNFISEYAGDDGFSSVKPAVNIQFENVEGRYNMDQGMSHHGSGVVVRRSHFHHNAGCGVVDVYPEARTRYEDCLIEYDTWRGGVEFHRGNFEMVNCVIRGNPRWALSVNKGAQVRLQNCLLTGQGQNTAFGVKLDEGNLTMENCTLYNFKTGLYISRLSEDSHVSIRNCAFLKCQINWDLNLTAPQGDSSINLSKVINSDGNAFESFPFLLSEKNKIEGRGQDKKTSFSATEWDVFRKKSGSDANSLIINGLTYDKDMPLTLPELAGRGGDGTDIGARLLNTKKETK